MECERTNTELSRIKQVRYIVWEDFGCEGWRPRLFADEAAALNYLTNDYHGTVIVTRPVNVELAQEEE